MNGKNFNEKRFRLVITLKELLYFFLVILISIGIFYIFYNKIITLNFGKPQNKAKYITIYLNNESYIEGLLFTLMISLLLLAFLQALGFNLSRNSFKYRLFILIFVLYTFALGFVSTGIGILFSEKIQFGIFKLGYSKFESNSLSGIKFYILNFYPFLIALYIFSYPFDSRRKK